MKKILDTCIVLVLSAFLLGCQPAQFFPKEGVWYCTELEMQLDFRDQSNCLFMYEGEAIVCSLGYDRGSSWLTVGCQDTGTSCFAMGEEVFGAEFVRLEADRLILLEIKSGKEYCFQRIQ